jgi:hypothetical protein
VLSHGSGWGVWSLNENASLRSVFFSTHGKELFCRVPFFNTGQRVSLSSVFFDCNTCQRLCRVCGTLGKEGEIALS